MTDPVTVERIGRTTSLEDARGFRRSLVLQTGTCGPAILGPHDTSQAQAPGGTLSSHAVPPSAGRWQGALGTGDGARAAAKAPIASSAGGRA